LPTLFNNLIRLKFHPRMEAMSEVPREVLVTDTV